MLRQHEEVISDDILDLSFDSLNTTPAPTREQRTKSLVVGTGELVEIKHFGTTIDLAAGLDAKILAEKLKEKDGYQIYIHTGGTKQLVVPSSSKDNE